jgi:hypothetical protein
MRGNDHGWRAELISRNISRATRITPHRYKNLDLRLTSGGHTPRSWPEQLKKLLLPVVAFSAALHPSIDKDEVGGHGECRASKPIRDLLPR